MTGTAHELRGGAVGAVTGALAVAAHGVGGGGTPSSASATFLLAVCVALGVAAGATMRRTGGPVALLAWLAVGQAAGHWALSLHVGSEMPMADHGVGPAMLAAHVVATSACATLVFAGERLWGPITSVLRAVFRVLAPPVEAPPRLTFVPDADRVLTPTVPASTISRRGPPRFVGVRPLLLPPPRESNDHSS